MELLHKWRVSRAPTTGTTDSDHQPTPGPAAKVYEGPCTVQEGFRSVDRLDTGDERFKGAPRISSYCDPNQLNIDDNVEAWFWLQYSERVYENGPCFLAECEAKVRGSEDLVPCAYLAMARGEGAYAQQIRAMRVLASVQLTSRMRYIQRMIG